MAVSHAAGALQLNRSLHYRARPAECGARDAELRAQLEKCIAQLPGCGYKKYAAALGENHKRVYRLMRKWGLLQRPKRRCAVTTTDSNHALPVFENLARGILPNGLDQLWVGDITYIRVGGRFMYLAVVMDARSRRILGWALASHMRAELCTAALRMAAQRRGESKFGGRLVFHSDRGSQYASHAHRELLSELEITGSMSRKGNCYDNAQAESFFRTLKVEEVYLKDYRSCSEARFNIEHFIEEVYNKLRYHWSLGLQTPDQFEQSLLVEQVVA
jgi:transposase InsO family protein